jgi:uncharacterized protein (TIGR03435 family)
LIELAWSIYRDEMLVGASKSMESKRFDIVAQTPVGGPSPSVDFEDVRPMLRTLIRDRFVLKTHVEERPVTAYTLEAGKPKLTKAETSRRTSCKQASDPGDPDPRDLNLLLSKVITCHNVTMKEFAGELQSLSSLYIFTPVQDSTGMEGAWDFTFAFNGYLPKLNTSAAADSVESAPTFFDALSQLGLKLVMRKRPMPVLVIDSIAENPTDN